MQVNIDDVCGRRRSLSAARLNFCVWFYGTDSGIGDRSGDGTGTSAIICILETLCWKILIMQDGDSSAPTFGMGFPSCRLEMMEPPHTRQFKLVLVSAALWIMH